MIGSELLAKMWCFFAILARCANCERSWVSCSENSFPVVRLAMGVTDSAGSPALP